MPLERRAIRPVVERLEVQTVPELVQQHGHQVRLCTMLVVEAQVEIEIAAELGIDVVGVRLEVDASPLVGECRAVPSVGKLGARELSDAAEVAGSRDGTGTSQDVRGQWVERSLDSDRDVAVQRRAPDFCGKLER